MSEESGEEMTDAQFAKWIAGGLVALVVALISYSYIARTSKSAPQSCEVRSAYNQRLDK